MIEEDQPRCPWSSCWKLERHKNSLSNSFLSSLQLTHSLGLFNVLSLNSLLLVSLSVLMCVKVIGNPPIYRVSRPKFFPKMLIIQIRKVGAAVLVNSAVALSNIKWWHCYAVRHKILPSMSCRNATSMLLC